MCVSVSLSLSLSLALLQNSTHLCDIFQKLYPHLWCSRWFTSETEQGSSIDMWISGLGVVKLEDYLISSLSHSCHSYLFLSFNLPLHLFPFLLVFSPLSPSVCRSSFFVLSPLISGMDVVHTRCALTLQNLPCIVLGSVCDDK